MWTPYFFFQRYLAVPEERLLGLEEPLPCPDRKVILPEPANDAEDWGQRGCEAEPWRGTARVEGAGFSFDPPWPPGVPDHAVAGNLGRHR